MYRRPTSIGDAARSAAIPLFRMQSYKHLLYLVLAFPIGMLYAMTLGVGLFVGIALSLVLIGILILAVLLVFIHIGIRIEQWLARRLLSVELDPRDDADSARGHLEAPSTWRGLGFLSLKFWLGIVGIILLFGLSTAWSLVSALFDRPAAIDLGEVNGEPVVWTIETLPEAAGAAMLGIVIAVALVHLANLFGYLAARMAESLLQ